MTAIANTPGVESLRREDGEHVAYMRRAGVSPGLVWLGGFKSEMAGNKASALDDWAARNGRAYLRFDYYGHGRSSGDFRKATISRWREDALTVIDQCTEGPQILIGSSMGAWIALLCTLERAPRVAGLLLIAPATDFTEALLWQRLNEDIKREMTQKGEWLARAA